MNSHTDTGRRPLRCTMCEWIDGALLHPRYAEERRSGHKCSDWRPPEQLYGTQHSCGVCDNQGGGLYKAHETPTYWWMGLDQTGQAHYVCSDCKDSLYNVAPCYEDPPEHVNDSRVA